MLIYLNRKYHRKCYFISILRPEVWPEVALYIRFKTGNMTKRNPSPPVPYVICTNSFTTIVLTLLSVQCVPLGR